MPSRSLELSGRRVPAWLSQQVFATKCLITLLSLLLLISLSDQQHQQQQRNHEQPVYRNQSRSLSAQIMGSTGTQAPRSVATSTQRRTHRPAHNKTAKVNNSKTTVTPTHLAHGTATGGHLARTGLTVGKPKALGRALHEPERRHSGEQYLQQDTRVPFWNIAHMINSIEQIETALREGANGIETDISFDAHGKPVEAYHGFPCDCGRHCHYREDFRTLLRHLGELAVAPLRDGVSSVLQLVLFDLKLKPIRDNEQAKAMAGHHLASSIHELIFERYQEAVRRAPEEFVPHRPPMRVIVSVNHASDVALVRAFIDYMQENQLDFMTKQVGFDVGMNDDLKEIQQMWDSLGGKTFNIWQGDGLTNCANIVRGHERLKQAISVRNEQGHFRKIYYWTVDISYHIRSVLRLGLDATLSNKPERVVQVLQEPEFVDKYRLASPFDDPFLQFRIEPTNWQMSPPTLEEARETLANIHETSAQFVKTLPDGISAAVKKVHSSLIQRSVR